MAITTATHRRTHFISCMIAGAMAVAGSVVSAWAGPTPSASTPPLFTAQSYPRVDGSTVTQPLGVAFQSLFTGTDVPSSQVVFNKTDQAYLNLINGEADLILVTSPSQDELSTAAQAGVELEVIPVVNEGFVFLTNSDNPVTSLTVDQIRDSYSGKTTNWKQVGGPDEPITAYQRPENSGSQTGMEDLVMQGTPMISAPTLSVETMNGLVDAIANFNGGSGSLGYSYYYYVTQMYGDLAANPQLSKIKLMDVNGVQPSADTIRSGQYPLGTAYYIVINKAAAPDSPARILANAMLSHDGQQTAMEAGYVPVDTSIALPQPTAPDPNALTSADGTFLVNPLTFTTTRETVMGVLPGVTEVIPECYQVDRLTVSGLADHELQDQINARLHQIQDDMAGLTSATCDPDDNSINQEAVQSYVDANFSNVLSLRTIVVPPGWNAAGYGEESGKYISATQTLNVRLDTGDDLALSDVFTGGSQISGMIQLEAQASDGFCDEACANDKATTYLSDPDQPFSFTSAAATVLDVAIPFATYWPQVAIFNKYAAATGLYSSPATVSCPIITTNWNPTYQACLPYSSPDEDLGTIQHVSASAETADVTIPANTGERWFAFVPGWAIDPSYTPYYTCSSLWSSNNYYITPSSGTGPASSTVTISQNLFYDSVYQGVCVLLVDSDTHIGRFGMMVIQQDPFPPSWVITVNPPDGTTLTSGKVELTGTLTDLNGSPVINDVYISTDNDQVMCESEVTPDWQGKWDCVLDTTIPDGKITISVVAENDNGSWGRTTVTYTIDTSPHPTASASPSAPPASPSATQTASPPLPTNLALPTASATSTASASTTVSAAPATSAKPSTPSTPTGGNATSGTPFLGLILGISLICAGIGVKRHHWRTRHEGRRIY